MLNKKGLGKGLQALLPRIESEGQDDKIAQIPLEQIRVNKNQPRQVFDETKLAELAESIKEHGVVQPILLKKNEDQSYEIVAGERRWRASKLAGLKLIPAIIKDLSTKEISEIALIENIQRENLNPIEEAVAYNTLMEEYGLTQDELSRRVGKSRSFIANTVRLLNLSETIKMMLSRGELTAGHARAFMALSKDKDREELARMTVEKGFSVRQVEQLVKDMQKPKATPKKSKPVVQPILSELEEQLRERFSTKVSIKQNKNKGVIELEYYGDEELQRLLDSLLGIEEY